ncbi:hypothetical protein J4440_04130 [Candidatus Woesearchaeota archaeon]|nr:hypothetical protein [Candidatus Woesearchaeota archaeon]
MVSIFDKQLEKANSDLVLEINNDHRFLRCYFHGLALRYIFVKKIFSTSSAVV